MGDEYTVVATVSTTGGTRGSNLGTLAITPNGAFGYATVGSFNEVAVFDTTNTVVARVFVGNFPQGVAITPDGAFAYVTNNNDGTVSVINTATNQVVATVPVGANPYGVAITPMQYVALVQQPINPDGSSIFNASGGVIPVKFSLSLNGTATCQLPAATIALTRTAGGTLGAIDESIYLASADSGSNFRISSCQYVYNLAAQPLGTGAYRVDIKINGSVVGNGVFALK